MPVTINEGTQTVVNATAVGGTQTQVIRLDTGSGTTAAEFGGTINRVTDLLKGTLTNLISGTVDTIGLINANAWGTVVSTGTSTLGTIKPAVSGSVIYLTDITISVGSASNVVIASGGTAFPMLGTLFFNANGGLVGNYRNPLQTVSGSALVFQQSAAISPLTIQANGYVK